MRCPPFSTRTLRVVVPALLAALALLSSGCQYMTAMGRQTLLSAREKVASEAQVRKHMLECQTAFVFGEVRAAARSETRPLAVLALNRNVTGGAPVDVCHSVRQDSYYGVNLPSGHYCLLLVEDQNGDGWYRADEVLADRCVEIDEGAEVDRVLSDVHLETLSVGRAEIPPFEVKVKLVTPREESLFYPKGTLRSLDDEVFSPSMSALGLYEPAAFLERAPLMFYALEDDNAGKVPVVFVHGINGSARDFQAIVNSLDRRRFKPWFFHYPSGMDLKQLSSMFHRIFLSGKVIPLADTRIVIVAHSMGGLIVRDALNRYTGSAKEPKVSCLITIASPLAGHPGAREATHSLYVVPSWKNLNPDSDFVHGLHRRPLPAETVYHLYYAFANTGVVKLGENSDGVVPLSSQLPEVAQREAREQFGFNATHTGVLSDPGFISRLLGALDPIEPDFPPEQVALLRQGGYQLSFGSHYSRLDIYLIRNIGYFMDALAAGRIKPANSYQQDFIDEVHGRKRPSTPASKAYIKLRKDFPNLPQGPEAPSAQTNR